MPASPLKREISIVGGGMVGLTLALLLAKRRPDWQVTLIESYPLEPAEQGKTIAPSFDARSTALAEGSRSILQQAGVWPYLADQLTEIQQVHVSDGGHFAGNLMSAADAGVPALGYVVENALLGQALLKALAKVSNITLCAPATVQNLNRTASGWQVQVNNQALTCDLLVLADGSQSVLGQQLGIRYRTDNYQQSAIIANVETNQAHRGIAYERFTSRGPIALLPLGLSANSQLSALVWTQPQAEVEQVFGLSDQAFCQRLQAEFGYRAGRFCRVSKRHCYPLQLSTATEQVRAGLVLMGNAAHFLHPVAGQGFNLALRDCLGLADAMNGANNPGDLTVLQGYLDKQQQDQTITVGLSHSLVKLFSTAAWPSALARSLGLLGLDALGPAKKVFSQQAMGFPVAKNMAGNTVP